MSATVLVIRSPDAETEIVTEGEVEVISVDFGSSFDTEPRTEEEAESARDMADSLEKQAAKLPPDSGIRGNVEEIVADLRYQADTILTGGADR